MYVVSRCVTVSAGNSNVLSFRSSIVESDSFSRIKDK
jgi:hypothetical protein